MGERFHIARNAITITTTAKARRPSRLPASQPPTDLTVRQRLSALFFLQHLSAASSWSWSASRPGTLKERTRSLSLLGTPCAFKACGLLFSRGISCSLTFLATVTTALRPRRELLGSKTQATDPRIPWPGASHACRLEWMSLALQLYRLWGTGWNGVEWS